MAAGAGIDGVLGGGSILPQLAGIGEVAPVYVYTGGQKVPVGSTAVFCQTTLGNAIAGAILGIYFWWEAEDYQTSPVSLVYTSAQSGQSAAASGGAFAGSPWTLQLGRDRVPLWFPSPWSIVFPQGTGAGLQITNNESSTLYAEGILVVAGWPLDSRRDAEQTQAQARGPWPGTPFASVPPQDPNAIAAMGG